MKVFLTIFFPILLSANLYFSNNYTKEVEVLNTFDVNASFLYDPVLNEMKTTLQQTYQTKLFLQSLQKASLFIPSMQKILTSYHIPKHFLYLAMAESNFHNYAYSTKRAAGLWQFMPYTASLYGLKIDEYVDERRDPIKSTYAAAKHLSFLYKKFGKWYLAAIAYNCGDGRLSRAIKEAKTDDLETLLDPDKKYIPKESRFYIRKILALALLANDEYFLSQNHNDYLLNRADTNSLATVTLPSGESLKRVAKILDISYEDLHNLNKHLKYPFIPPYKNGYTIYIPYNKLALFKQNYKPSAVQNTYIVYKVQKGDNLYKIGHKYNVSYKVIKDFNHLKNSFLHINQSLVIPIVKGEKIKKVDSKNYYMVKKGDTLESISKRYHISIENLRSQNNIKGSFIKIGDRLKIYE